MENKYYYFIDGHDKVFVRTEYICDGDGQHPQYHELSNQQIEWYLQHPEATAHEVKQLCLDSDMDFAGKDLTEYKSDLCGRLSILTESTISRLIPHDKLADAMLAVQENGEAAPQGYKDRIRYYHSVREAAKKEMARIRLMIARTSTHKDAEDAYNAQHITDIKTGKEEWK